jgi:hypothetical protein
MLDCSSVSNNGDWIRVVDVDVVVVVAVVRGHSNNT